MSDIKTIMERNERRKRLTSEGASADSKEFVEQVYELKEINRLVNADFDYLITTIEQQNLQLASAKLVIQEGVSLLEQSETTIESQNSQIESLKAITELAVKAIERVIEGNFIYLTEQRQYLKNTISEIERLSQ